MCYFLDDPWRVEFARFWMPHFHFITTLDTFGKRKYADMGCRNVLFSPFACNTEIHKKKDLPKKYDVSFVGGYHPQRAWIIQQMRKSGIFVHVFGSGWNRHHSQEEMVDIFNQSKINLNLPNNVCWDIRYLCSSYRAIRNTLGSLVKKDPKIKQQLTIRHFELGGCGAFQLSHYVEGLEHCYEIGKEIAIYTNLDDLVFKIRYYLAHDDEREQVALAACKRTLAEHTYEKRLQEIIAFVQNA